MLPKISGYVKSYDEHTKWMYFLIENDDLLENDNTIWDIVNVAFKKNLIVSLFKFFENQNKIPWG